MKRILALIISVMMLLSSLAVVNAATLDGKYVFESGNNVYVFGNVEASETFEEVGVKVGGKTYSVSPERKYQVEKTGKFGIGFNDPETRLGVEFDVTPYTRNGEVINEGGKIAVKRDALLAVSDVTVGGKSVSGFFSGTSETDFYYGLEVLPETADGLPEVVVAAGDTAYEVSVKAETGGYVAAAYYNDEEILRVHFREFSEKTEKVPVTNIFRVKYTHAEFTSDSGAAASNNTAKTVGVIDNDNNDILAYATYEIPEIEGYAPVSYSGKTYVVLPNNATVESAVISAYNYFGDLSGFKAPERKSDAPRLLVEIPSEMKRFAGFTGDDTEKISDFTAVASTKSYEYTSNTINGKNHIIIYKAEDGAESTAFVRYSDTSYTNEITVKYVEKNPRPDMTIENITVGGKTVSGYYKGTTETDFYYGLEALPENADELPDVFADAKDVEYNVTVKPEVGGYVASVSYDGEEYARVHFREFSEVTKEVAIKNMYRVEAKKVEFSHATDPVSSTNTASTFGDFSSTSKSVMSYAHYEIPEIEGYAPVYYSCKTAVSLSGTSTVPSLTVSAYNYFGNLSDFTGLQRKAEGSKAVAADTHGFKGFGGFSGKDADKAGEFVTDTTSTRSKTFDSYTVNGKNVIIIYKNEDVNGNAAFIKYSTSYPNAITVKYVEKAPELNPEISNITVGGKTVSGYYEGTTETDFYYGLEELPADASALPAVAVVEAENQYGIKSGVSVESEEKGYAAVITFNDKVVAKIHFRAFAREENVSLTNMYRVEANRIKFTSKTDKASVNNTAKTVGSITAGSESILNYAHYEIPVIEGYAPVYYTCKTGVLLSGNATVDSVNVSAYNYSGSLKNFVTPARKAEGSDVVASDTTGFTGFGGFSGDAADKIAEFEAISSKNSVTLESFTVNGENAVIIYKSENVDGEVAFIRYEPDSASYNNALTVKYVEK